MGKVNNTAGKKLYGKKTFTRIAATLLAVIAVFTLVPSECFAKNFDRTFTYSQINPTAAELTGLSGYDALKGKNAFQAIRISKAGQFNAFSFTEKGLSNHSGISCYTTGWYSIYSTGSKDTVGALYTTEWNMDGWPWNWKKEAVVLARDDDGGEGLNFSIVYKMTKGETVYVTSRLYGYGTGQYDVSVKPYQDTLVSDRGGYWEVSKGEKVNVDGYYGTNVTKSKLYLTADQVATMYEILRQMIADSVISRERLKMIYDKQGYPAAVDKLFSVVGDTLISFAPAWVQTLYKCGNTIYEVLSPVFEDTLDMFLNSPEDLADICIQLEDIGGAGYDRGTPTAENGIVITTKWEDWIGGYVDNYYFEEYNSTTLYGGEYEKGTWKGIFDDETYSQYLDY